MRTLVAIPVYNEEKYVSRVLARVLEQTSHVLVIDDGSTDTTPSFLPKFPVDVIRHKANRGYGRSMRDAFAFAAMRGYEWVITMDCDEQHEPASIPAFLERIAADQSDIISGSRYMPSGLGAEGAPPADRRTINTQITRELNARLGFDPPLTDAFCGFKAYRVEKAAAMPLTENGYAFPMQFWVQAVAMGMRVEEIPVRLIYNDPNRSFGGPLDDPATRLAHYRAVLEKELCEWKGRLPAAALRGVPCCGGRAG
jgi:glycosyltransferase involved in cell wall biosynthesis